MFELGLPPLSVGPTLPPFLPPVPADPACDRMSAERIHAERIALAQADPVMRLHMANNAAAAAAAAQAHMHTHAHSHTHLHVHQQEMMQQHLANLNQLHQQQQSSKWASWLNAISAM
jgi:hypothetical protein